MRYAQAVVENKFPVGVIMIDCYWGHYYGNLEFRRDRFPDPKEMIAKLHKLGFKVMVWVSPFVTPDSPEFLLLEEKGYLVKKKNSKRK